MLALVKVSPTREERTKARRQIIGSASQDGCIHAQRSRDRETEGAVFILSDRVQACQVGGPIPRQAVDKDSIILRLYVVILASK